MHEERWTSQGSKRTLKKNIIQCKVEKARRRTGTLIGDVDTSRK